MPAIAICDGCGVHESMVEFKDGQYHKPASWYIRLDGEHIELACSETCIKKIENNTGVKSAIITI